MSKKVQTKKSDLQKKVQPKKNSEPEVKIEGAKNNFHHMEGKL